MAAANVVHCADEKTDPALTKEQEAGMTAFGNPGALPSYSSVVLQQHPAGQDFTAVMFQQPTTQPAVVTAPAPREKAPKDYLYMAIFSTICCFWPVGLFAIVKSRDVHKRMSQGDHKAAAKSSRKAKYLSVIAMVLGILLYIIVAAAVGTYLANRDENGSDGDGHPFNEFINDDTK